MAGPKLFDRVYETTTTTGTGTVTLAGAYSSDYRSFTSVLSDQDTCFYTIEQLGTGNWEVGIGTFTAAGTTLARTIVLASSNAGGLVNFPAGTKSVWLDLPAGAETWPEIYHELTNSLIIFTGAEAVLVGGEDCLKIDTGISLTQQANSRLRHISDRLLEMPGQPRGNSNLLINGDCGICQRQNPLVFTAIPSTSSADQYFADQWKLSGTNNYSFLRTKTVTSPEPGITAASYGTVKCTLSGLSVWYQPIEAVNTAPLVGGFVTFQAKLKASSNKTVQLAIMGMQANLGATADSLPSILILTPGAGAQLGYNDQFGLQTMNFVNCSVTTSWQLFSVTALVPAGMLNLILAIWPGWLSTNDTISFTEVGCYPGTIVQPWTPRSAAQELALCQRFCVKTCAPDNPVATSYDGCLEGTPSVSNLAGGLCVHWTFPTTMRTTPSIKGYDTQGNANQWFGTGSPSTPGLAFASAGVAGVTAYNSTNVGTPGELYVASAIADAGL